jgi:phosphatidylglycerol:prolipoprotein diacylglycerol transferase
MPIAPWLDIAAVGLPLGQAIGRWANFVNQELYGFPTDLPWGISIDSAHRVAPFKSLVEYPLTQGFHPLFLYESLWSLLFFIVLLNIFLRYRRRLFSGDVFLIYLLQYSAIRFLLEGIRVEVTMIGGVNLSQAFMAVVFVVALLILGYRHRPGAAPAKRDTPESPQTASGNS